MFHWFLLAKDVFKRLRECVGFEIVQSLSFPGDSHRKSALVILSMVSTLEGF